MLFVKPAAPLIEKDPPEELSPAATVYSVLGIMNWRRKTILWSLAAFLLAGLIYVLLRPPAYTAQTNLLIYNTKVAFSREDALFAESQLDPTFLETQIQILRSDKISLAVIERLGLANEASTGSGWFGSRKPSGEQDTGDERRQVALKAFQRNLSVERIGLSYVVNVAFTASDPEKAARVANEVARAYVEDQNAARLEAAQSASAWLRERIKDLGPRTRVIAEALPPREKSSLRSLLVLAISGIAGLAAGLALAFARELLDRRIRTPENAVTATGAECLGIIPKLKIARLASPQQKKRAAAAGEQQRHISDVEPLLAHAIDQPRSLFWHSLRNVKVSLDIRDTASRLRRLGVTSAVPGEGTTTVSANLARLLASSGDRVLLVDCNHTDPRLSNVYTPGDNVGLIDLLEADGKSFERHVWTDPRTGMHFLPVGGCSDRYRRSSVIWSERTATLMDQISERYDYAVFDLPPLAPAADVRAAAELLSHFLLVVGWNQVTDAQLEVGLNAAGATHAKLLGTLLNQVDVISFERLSSPGTNYFTRGMHASRRHLPKLGRSPERSSSRL